MNSYFSKGKEKLKTLKDVGIDVGTHLIIKTEAIKWIKDECPDKDENGKECKYCQGGSNWIKHFFNITEEDLNKAIVVSHGDCMGDLK